MMQPLMIVNGGHGRISILPVDCEPGREWHGRPARGSEESPDMGKMPMPHRAADIWGMRAAALTSSRSRSGGGPG
jgi:hypothetical protein